MRFVGVTYMTNLTLSVAICHDVTGSASWTHGLGDWGFSQVARQARRSGEQHLGQCTKHSFTVRDFCRRAPSFASDSWWQQWSKAFSSLRASFCEADAEDNTLS